MPLALRVGAGDRPELLRSVGATHVDLLAVDHVLVAVADSADLHPGQVRAGARLGQKLPGAHLSLEDGRQEVVLLLLAAPDQDAGAAEASAAVIVGRDRKVVLVQLFLDHDGVVDCQPAAAVLRRGGGPEPALFAQLVAQFPVLQIVFVGGLSGVGRIGEVFGNVLLQPFPYLGPELLLLFGIPGFEVQVCPPQRWLAFFGGWRRSRGQLYFRQACFARIRDC